MRKSAYVFFVAILVSLQAAICSTASPNTFTGSTSYTAFTEDFDIGDVSLTDKLMRPVGAAIGGFMSRHPRPGVGLPPRGAVVSRPAAIVVVTSSTTLPPSTST